VSYVDYDKEELTKEILIADENFLQDAGDFLAERENIAPESPEEIYDEYMEHFRYQTANEVTATKDLTYAQEADDEGKARMGRLMKTFDRMPSRSMNPFTAEGRKTLGDYGEAVVAAPSTYVGLASAGVGKLASFAGTKAIGQLARGAVIGGAVDAAVGGATDYTNQSSRVETGNQDDINYGQVAASSALSAAPGAVLGAGNRVFQGKRAAAANKLLDIDEAAGVAAKEAADVEVAKIAKTKSGGVKLEAKVSKFTENETRIQNLKNLDPTRVAAGKEQGVSLDLAVIRRVAAAAIEVEKKVGLKGKETDRITETVANSLKGGKLLPEDLLGIYNKFGITADDFSNIYMHEISEAAKKMQAQGTIKRFLRGDASPELTAKLDAADTLDEVGVAAMNKETMQSIVSQESRAGRFVKDLDKARLGMMTSQMATAMRNNWNGVMRLGVDAADRLFYNIIDMPTKGKLKNPLQGVFTNVGNLTINTKHGRLIEELMSKHQNEKASRVFMAMADVEGKVPSNSNSLMINVARKLNFMNTASDNAFKRATISAGIKRRLYDATGEDLMDVLGRGEFNKISPEIMEGAIEDALKYTYQSSPKGQNIFSQAAKGTIFLHQKLPFTLSSVMPFPRFVANSLEFIYEHTPIIPLFRLERRDWLGLNKKILKDTDWADKLSKQVTGAGMFLGAYAIRNELNDEGLKWYQFKDTEGKIIDGRALLGPFQPFFLLADMVNRYKEGKKKDGKYSLQAEGRTISKDVMQSLSGSTFRVGSGLYMVDEMIDLLNSSGEGMGEEKLATGLARIIGDTLNTFTLPANQIADIASQYNPEMRKLKETRTTVGSIDSVDFLDYMTNRALRSVRIGESDLPDKERSTKKETPTRQRPIAKQFAGLSYEEDKTPIQQELDRLQIEPFTIIKSSGDPEVDHLTRQGMGELVSAQGSAILNNPEYPKIGESFDTAAERDSAKRDFLLGELSKFALDARKYALETSDEMSRKSVETGASKIPKNSKLKWGRLKGDRRTVANARFKQRYGMSVNAAIEAGYYGSYDEALAIAAGL
tara:strand:- start:5004 stop:8150 length:3147 start_codon:yes stop_codon:yes gene_type:complete